jgi:hypothetical protein
MAIKIFYLKQISFVTERRENISSIVACSLFAGETCPQSFSLATAVVLSSVYTAVTLQCVYMSQNVCPNSQSKTLQNSPYSYIATNVITNRTLYFRGQMSMHRPTSQHSRWELSFVGVRFILNQLRINFCIKEFCKNIVAWRLGAVVYSVHC